MGKTIVQMIDWMIAFGALAMALMDPERPFRDRPVWVGIALLLMVYAATWDPTNKRFRLPFRLPAGTILVLPIGFAVFTLARIQWHSPDWWVKLFFGFNPLVFYLTSLLTQLTKRPKTT